MTNLSEEKENAFFADGIQDELLSNLSKIKSLKVISRTSVMQYKSGITRNLKEIAQQLGVSNVVEGSVRRSGNHIRVSVQLIDALTDRHIWVQNYDRTLADSLALQGELATEIAAGVGATLSPQEKARVEAKPTNNPAAYDAYLRARAFAGGSPFDKPTVENAIRSYQEAVKLDPAFALAWARLSYAQSNSYWLGHDPSPAQLAAAKDAADHALALDPNLPETHLALGYYRYYGQRDFTGGLEEFQQAEKGLPNNVDITNAIAFIQRRLGHWEEAIDGLRRAIELDPRNTNAYNELAATYTALRRFPEALATLDRVLAWEPTNADALKTKAPVFWAMGDLEAVEPLLGNPGIEPGLRGVQALFQRRYAAAIEIFSSEVAAKTKRGEPQAYEVPQNLTSFESAARRRCCRGAGYLPKRGAGSSARSREGRAGFLSGGEDACPFGSGLCTFGRSSLCYRRRTKSHGHASHFQRPVRGSRGRGDYGGHLRGAGRCRSRDSHSQAAIADTLWRGSDYSGGAATRSVVGSNPQRSSLSGIGRRKAMKYTNDS